MDKLDDFFWSWVDLLISARFVHVTTDTVRVSSSFRIVSLICVAVDWLQAGTMEGLGLSVSHYSES